MHIIRTFSAAFVLLALLVSPSAAQFPDHGLKIYIAWPPAGSTDIVGRFVAERLSTALKQPVVVENRPGANGNIGADMFVKLPPDGYSLMVATAETHAINPHVYSGLSYEVLRDFEPIALLARVDFVLAVKSGLDVKNVQDLVALAKASPGKIPVGSYGVGSTSHLALAALEERTGATFLHVPYRGVSPAVNALLTGEIDAAFVSPATVSALEKNGQVKIIGSASMRRPALAPNAATFEEQGIPNFVNGNWYGLVAPKGIPADVRQRLTAEVNAIATSSAFAQRAEASGLVVEYLDADRFRTFLKDEGERWRRIVEARKIKVDR